MKEKNSDKSPSSNIITRKRKVPPKDRFVEMEDTAYETLNISKRKIQTGQYLKEFLKETSSAEAVIEAIRVTIDALLDSISSDMKSLSAAALVPHPESSETKAI